MSLNPILPGFYPDPSICFADGRYVLANSTFQYLPGIPLHESPDLVNWSLVGHAFTRIEQLDLTTSPSNAGLYAPTIRYREGVFYVVTSDLMTARLGHLIVHADNLAGPWSDPVRTSNAIGIDPDLFWDDDGTCHLTWKGISPTGLSGILSAPVDPLTGVLMGKARKLWQGSTGQASPEGPHVYRRGAYYYCLLAEGGTERTHCASIARAESLEGPWEPHPHNPILTHRGTNSLVQNTGHADLVEHPDGSWAAVYLGVRPRGFVPQFHVNGRETFLADVHWQNDWPTIIERSDLEPVDTAFSDDFTKERLDERWVSHGGVHFDHTSVLSEGLSIRRVGADERYPTIAVRARDETWEAIAEFNRPTGMQVHMDTDNWVEVSADDTAVRVTASVSGKQVEWARASLQTPPDALVISAISWPDDAGINEGPDMLVFSVRQADGTSREIARIDGRLMSTEVVAGFTGRMIGVRPLGRRSVLKRFSYRPTPPIPRTAPNPFHVK